MNKLLLLLMACFTLGAANAQMITEFHYDNTGTDSQEFVEVYIPNTETASDYTVVLYNGSNGSPYNTQALDTSDPDVSLGDCDGSGCYYVIDYPSNGIQNGNPDGLALCSSTGVVEFLSYEGDFTASGGCADGMMSTEITASESSSTPTGFSLANDGSGTWTSGPSSAGSSNPAQSVKLVSFSATWNARNVELTWTTASEENNDYFVVERSTDGRDFISLDEVKGNGNAAREHNYSFIDYQPSFTNYYRLVQVDYDGTATTSEVVTARKELKDNVRLMNTRVESVVSIDNNTDDEIAYTIVAMDGRIIAEGQLQSGMNDVDCQSLQGGIYVFSMRMADQMISEKIQKL